MKMHVNYYYTLAALITSAAASNSCSGRPPLLYHSLENCCGFLLNSTYQNHVYLDDCWGSPPFLYDKDNLESLTLVNCFIDLRPESKLFEKGVSIKSLKINNCNIMEIGAENFKNLEEVEIIDLSNNNIVDIRLNTFTYEELPNLRIINFTGNPLSEESILILNEIANRFDSSDEDINILVYCIIGAEVIVATGLCYGIWILLKLLKRKRIPIATEDHDNSALQLELEDHHFENVQFSANGSYSSFTHPRHSISGYNYYDRINEVKL